MSRLSIELTKEQHQKIKTLAALQGMSIKDLVLDRLFPKSHDEDKEWKKLMSFLESRIAEARKNESTPRTLDEIASDVLRSKSAV